MDKDTLKGDWNIIKGKVKENWGRFTDDDLTQINGKKDQLLGLMQKKYGYAKEKAEMEYSNWEKKFRENKVHNDEQEHLKHSNKH
ncbi:MAG: CsbD family protein [Parachlamydiaceae bacterium]|nr:CsbD family protein [Parachlamydiaceae bacterium]